MTLLLETSLGLGQNAVNYALSLDPHTQSALSELNNKCIAVNLTQFSRNIYLQIIAGNIFLTLRAPHTVDLTIQASPKDLWNLAQKSQTPQQQVQMHGNMHVAQKLSHIMHNFQPDWEEALCEVAGDIIGHALAQTARQFYSYLQNLGDSILQNSAEYLTDETDLIATKPTIDKFVNDVDTLRHQCDRLAVRVRLCNERVS